MPIIKLAFELNGIYHYEPIHGIDKLNAIQNNDNRKILACSEHSIELCVIDVNTMKNFKEQKAKEFLSIIKTIIDNKLVGGVVLETTKCPAPKAGGFPLILPSDTHT